MSMAEFMVLRARVTALEAVVAALQARIETLESHEPFIEQSILESPVVKMRGYLPNESGELVATSVPIPSIPAKRGPGRPRKDGNQTSN